MGERTRRPPLAPAGDLFRIQAEVSIDELATVTLNVRGTTIVLNQKTVVCGTKPIPLADLLTKVEVLVDRTSVETFANDGEVSLSKCFLPSESGLYLKATGGRALIKSLRLIRLKSAWNDGNPNRAEP